MASAEYEAKIIQHDLDVPGLASTTIAAVAETRIWPYRFQKLEDGGVFMTIWRGAPDCEQMVGYHLFDVAEAKQLQLLFKG